MKIYSKDHQKALNLRNSLEEATVNLNNYVDSQVNRQTDSDALFQKKYNALSKKEDEAYLKYYNHMNKDFSKKQIDKAILSKKYKEKFVDKKLVNDLYRDKTKKVENGRKKENTKLKRNKRKKY